MILEKSSFIDLRRKHHLSHPVVARLKRKEPKQHVKVSVQYEHPAAFDSSHKAWDLWIVHSGISIESNMMASRIGIYTDFS